LFFYFVPQYATEWQKLNTYLHSTGCFFVVKDFSAEEPKEIKKATNAASFIDIGNSLRIFLIFLFTYPRE
jgi:hypothetical protein